MRKLVSGLAGAFALMVATFSAAPAQAESFSISFSSGPRYAHPVYYQPRPVYYGQPVYHARPVYRARPVRYGHPVYARPVHYARPVYYAPRHHHCFKRVERHWDGYGWVKVKRRICR